MSSILITVSLKNSGICKKLIKAAGVIRYVLIILSTIYRLGGQYTVSASVSVISVTY